MTLSRIVQKALTPLVYISLAVMIASGAWLVALGHIMAVWPPVLVLIFAPFVLPVLMIPAALSAGVMKIIAEVYPRASKIMGFLSLLYLVALLSLYAVAVFYCVTGLPLVPAALFAIAASVAPWAILAIKDRENVFFTGLVLMTAGAGAALVFLAPALGLRSFGGKYLAFFALLGGMVLLQALYEKIFLKKPPSETKTPAV